MLCICMKSKMATRKYSLLESYRETIDIFEPRLYIVLCQHCAFIEITITGLGFIMHTIVYRGIELQLCFTDISITDYL